MRDAATRPQRRQGVRLPLNQDPAKLRIKRIAAGLQQQELALRANCSKGHMSEIEKGRRSASPELLGRFAEILGCPIVDLINTDAANGSSK